jgi:hypothetical protein
LQSKYFIAREGMREAGKNRKSVVQGKASNTVVVTSVL